VIRADGPSKCLLNCAEKQFRQMAERKIQSGKASISKSAWTNVMCQCQKNCPRNRGREMVSWVGKCQHGFISQMSCLRWGCVISPPICRMWAWCRAKWDFLAATLLLIWLEIRPIFYRYWKKKTCEYVSTRLNERLWKKPKRNVPLKCMKDIHVVSMNFRKILLLFFSVQ